MTKPHKYLARDAWVPSGIVKGNPTNVGPAIQPHPAHPDVGKSVHEIPIFSATIGEAFIPRSRPWMRSDRISHELPANTVLSIPANTILFFDGWTYGERIIDHWYKKPDDRWYRLFELPVYLNHPRSVRAGFGLPFKQGDQKGLSQPFACYLHQYNETYLGGFHPGEDWAGIFSVYAVATGKVIRKHTLSDNNGDYVVIEHPFVSTYKRKLYSHYLHLKPSNILVQENEVVYRGQKIGKVHKDHLHWEIRVANKALGANERIYTKRNKDGYYKKQWDIYDDGYVCPSSFVNSGKLYGKHKSYKGINPEGILLDCTCDPHPHIVE